MKKNFLILIITLILCINLASATIYYWNAQTGNDASTTGNITNPYQSLMKLGNGTWAAGDTLILQPGSFWRKQWLNITVSSGSGSNFITVNSTGAQIFGSINDTTFTDLGMGLWTSPDNSFPTNPNYIIYNTTGSYRIMLYESTCVDMTTGKWCYNSTNKSIMINNSLGNPSTTLGGLEIPINQTSAHGGGLINIEQKSNWIFNNLNITGCLYNCIFDFLGKNITVRNSTFKFIYQNTFYVNGDSSSSDVTGDIWFSNNTIIEPGLARLRKRASGETAFIDSGKRIYFNGNTIIRPHGVGLNFVRVKDGQINGNNITDCVANETGTYYDSQNMLYLDAVNTTTINNNYVRNCTIGMSINAELAGRTSWNNTFYNNTIVGAYVGFQSALANGIGLGIYNTNITHNTFIKTRQWSVTGEAMIHNIRIYQGTNITFKDNLIINNYSDNSGSLMIFNDSSVTAGFSSDYNDWYTTTGTNGNITRMVAGNTPFSTWITTGNDTHSNNTNPQITSIDTYIYSPRYNNWVCTHDDMGSYIGSIPCSADTTPPGDITNLATPYIGNSWIYINWTNPADADFNRTQIFRNGTAIINTSLAYYNATGLTNLSSYIFTLIPYDNSSNAGNNATITNTTIGGADTTPPGNVTGLSTSNGSSWIYLTWTNPIDADFNHTTIYKNGTYLINTTNTYINDTGLSPNSTFIYSFQTVDNNGNKGSNVTLATGTKPWESYILPTTAYMNQTLKGYCIGYGNGTTNLSYETRWYKNGSLIVQNNLNYHQDSDSTNCNDSLCDLDWNTGVNNETNTNTYYFNWSIDLVSTNTYLSFRGDTTGYDTEEIGPIAPYCLSDNNNTLMVKVVDNSGETGIINISCYSRFGWQTINAENFGLYELAVIFNTSTTFPTYIPNESSNTANLSNPYLTKNNYYLLSCRQATPRTIGSDKFYFMSSWINSTGSYINNTIPTVQANISPAVAYFNDTILTYCTPTDQDLDNLTINYTLRVNGVANTSGSLTSQSSLSMINVANITGISRGKNITITCTASDQESWSTQSNNSIIINNTAPVLSSIAINPSPANATNNLTCNYTATDADSDIMSGYYNWTINGATQIFHTSIMGSGNLSTGYNVTCSALVTDSYANSTWVSSNTLNVGDYIPPIITFISVSSTSPYNTDTVTFAATLSDLGNIDVNACKFTLRKSDYNGGQGVGNSFNYTTNTKASSTVSFDLGMSSLGPGILEFQKAYCYDGSMNLASNDSIGINLTISLLPTGGGGGGGSVITQPVQGFQIVRPVNGIINPLCPAGEKSGTQTFQLYNDQNANQTFTASFEGVNCTIDQATFTIASKTLYTGTILSCQCPLSAINGETKGQLVIKTGTYSNNIPIILYNNVFTRILSDSSFLVKAIAIIIILAGLVAIIFSLMIVK